MNTGEWFMWPVDDGMPEHLNVYTGEVSRRKFVRRITRQQARAFSRWHGHHGLYFGYKDRNDRWQDVYVVGDIDAWYSPYADEPIEETPLEDIQDNCLHPATHEDESGNVHCVICGAYVEG